MRFRGLIAAIVFAAIAAIIVLRMSASEAPPPKTTGPAAAAPQVKSVNIYVAAQSIPVGSSITQEMISVQPWPEHLVLDSFVRADAGSSKVVGMVARAPFQQQEPVLKTKLANPNDPNFLAGELPKGMRVITIQTNEIEGLAGFVFPGDRVDVLLTHDVEKWVNDPASTAVQPRPPHKEKEPVTETLITNVKVVAVDQRSSNAGAIDRDGKLVIPRSVSLMVSQSDAQRLRLGQKVGTLTLALRALADRESTDAPSLTSQRDISLWKQGDDETTAEGGLPHQPKGVTVIRGIESTESSADDASATTVTKPGAAPAGKAAK